MRRKASEGRSDGLTAGRTVAVALLLLTVGPLGRLAGQEPPLNAGALFLVFPVGAQAVGMGQTATAAAGRGEAAFWNPAGLATLSDDEFALHSASLVAGHSNVLSAYFPSRGIGVIGGAVYLVDYGDLDRTDINGNTIARIAPRNFEFRLQVNNQAQADPLPTRLAVGALYEVRLRPATGRALDQAFDVKLAADVDSPWGQMGQSETRLGLDVGYQRLVRVRAGYAFVQDGLSGPSVGLGVESGSLGIDLARAFLTGSDLQADNPTFFSFRVSF